jgi:hypothetical protein
MWKEQNIPKKFLRACCLWLSACFLVALPLGLYFLWHPQYFISRAAGISIFATENPLKALGQSLVKHLAMFNFKGDPNWRHNFAGQPMLFWPIGILFLIGFFISIKGLIMAVKRKKGFKFQASSFVIGWFFVMLLPGILTFEGIPHSLRVVGVVPVVYIFAAIGGWQVFEFLKKRRVNKKLLILGIVLFLFSMAFFQFDKYFNKWAIRPEVKNGFSFDYVKMGKYLNSLPKNVGKYVIVNQPGVPVPYPNGIPMPAQTIIFIQKTGGKQEVTYLLPEEIKNIKIEKEAIILPMREDLDLFTKLKNQFPTGKWEKKEGFWVLKI